jgi:hypothetical protein
MESGAIPEGHDLSPAHRQAETDLVAASEPRPSTVEGYVDEVDLGNGHTWRRREDGTWCRFTLPDLCGTRIRRSRLSPEEQRLAQQAEELRIREAEVELQEAQGRQARLREQAALLARIERAGEPIRLDRLTSAERDLLSDAMPHLEDLQTATMADIRRGKADLVREHNFPARADTQRAADALLEARRQTRDAAYDYVRPQTPRDPGRTAALRRAGGLDEYTGVLPQPRGVLAPDHVVPVSDLVDMPGFARLPPPDQLAIANDERFLRMMDAAANESRGDRAFAGWPQARNYYTESQLAAMSRLEDQLKGQIQEEINRRLQRAGLRLGR